MKRPSEYAPFIEEYNLSRKYAIGMVRRFEDAAAEARTEDDRGALLLCGYDYQYIVAEIEDAIAQMQMSQL